jgi:hypothetical protein
MDVRRKQMVEDISAVVTVSGEDRRKLNRISHWHLGVLPQNPKGNANE